MSSDKEKIITSQAIANDLISEFSALLSDENFDRSQLEPVYERLKELSNTLNDIPTHDVKF